MKVVVAAAAAADLRALPPPTKTRLKKAIVALADDPRGQKGLQDIKRLRTLRTESRVYRLRLGEWRIVYRVEGATVEVVRAIHRSEGYGWMDRLGY